MQHQRLFRLFTSAFVAMSALLILVGSPVRTAHAAPVCGATVQNVSGAITVNTTWSSANIYLLTGSVTVNAGVTLTIQPGTVIKARPNTGIYVHGTLSANGTVANSIYVTSEKDDTVCGDTNADGAATAPAVGDWAFVEFEGDSNDTSSLTRAVLSYGGMGYPSGSGTRYSLGVVRVRDASPTLSNLSMTQNYRNAAELGGETWNANTLSSSTVVYWMGYTPQVAANQTLTINPGVKIKATVNANLFIHGTLSANGTLAAPIYYTSEKDDTVCGVGASDEAVCDTDNAVSSPATSDWGFIEFEAGSSDTSSLTRAVLRYGGHGYPSGSGTAYSLGVIRLRDASPTLANLSMTQNYRNAAELAGETWNANTLSSSTVVYWMGYTPQVAANQTLTLGPGVKIKATVNANLFIHGKLTADGTVAAPIYFTSEKDDTVCGVGASDEAVCDTDNVVGSPATSDWGFIEFEAGSSDTSSLTRAVLRYGGHGYPSGSGTAYSLGVIRLLNASPTLDNLSMTQNYRNAAELGGGNWNILCTG